jgi:Mannosyltransferase (PIG-V)
MWRRVLVVWSASRVAVLSLGYLLTAELGWHRALQPWQTEWVRAVTGWDSVFYIRISHVGYRPGKLEAFFPLYPLGIRATRDVLEVGDAVAALLVANLAVLAALVGMYVLARDRLSEAHARRSILYLVLSPYAFVLAMAYSEGPYLALTVWMFVLSDREHDLAAAPLGFAASLTRGRGGAGRSRPGCSPLRPWPDSAPRRPGCSMPSAIRWGWCTCRPSGAGTRPSRSSASETSSGALPRPGTSSSSPAA